MRLQYMYQALFTFGTGIVNIPVKSINEGK